MFATGFEPAHPKISRPKRDPLNHSGKRTEKIDCLFIYVAFFYNMTPAYARALASLELTDDQKKQYPAWNWLMYQLNNYIWSIVGNNDSEDKWEEIDENNIYRLWLSSIVEELKIQFHDANRERAYKCLINCPDESVARIIYDATPVLIQNGFNKKFDLLNDVLDDIYYDTDDMIIQS